MSTGSMCSVPSRSSTWSRGQPFRLEPGERVFDAARLRLGAVFLEILPTAADAMHLLGEVHGLEPAGERAHQVARDRRCTTANALAQGALGSGVLTARDGRKPVALHQLEQCVTTLLAQDGAHDCAELVHILAKRGVLGRELDLLAVRGAVHGGAIVPVSWTAEPWPVLPADPTCRNRSLPPPCTARRYAADCSPVVGRPFSRPRDSWPRRCMRAAWTSRSSLCGARCFPCRCSLHWRSRAALPCACRAGRGARCCWRPAPARSATASARWWISMRCS